MRSTSYKECDCEKFFFLPSGFFSLYFTVGPRSQIIKLVETVLASLTFPLLPQLPSSPGSPPRPCPPLPRLPSPHPPPPPTTTTQSFPSDSLNSPSTVHTLRLERSPWFSPQGGTGLCGAVGNVGSVTSTGFTFCCQQFTVFFFFFFYFFCNSFAIIYQKVQKFDITISVCIIYL